jgi:hypothetical protein
MGTLEGQMPYPDGNACQKLAYEDPLIIPSRYKILVNSRYKTDLYHFVKNNYKDPNIIITILKAIIPFSTALKKLATNHGSRLVNIDLHSGNIFVNYDVISGPLTIGMADFGRCVYHDSTKSILINKDTWENYFLSYVENHDLSIRFVHIPFECRLFSLCMRSFADFPPPPPYTINHIIDTMKDYIYQTPISSQRQSTRYTEFTDSPDPLYYISERGFNILIDTFSPFIAHVIDWPLSPASKKSMIMDFILYRFNTIGFLGNLITTLSQTIEFQNNISEITRAVDEYIEYNNNIFKIDNISHRLVKFYFDELLRPYSGDFTDINDVVRKEKEYNFSAAFALAMDIHIPPGPPVVPSRRPPLHPSRLPPPVPGAKKGGRRRQQRKTQRKRR